MQLYATLKDRKLPHQPESRKNMLEEQLRIFMGPLCDTFEMMLEFLGSRNWMWNRTAERFCSMDGQTISITFRGRRANGTLMLMAHPGLLPRGQLPKCIKMLTFRTGYVTSFFGCLQFTK